MIILGVPVLSRYDLLERLFASSEAGRIKPDLYLVVDNGGRFDPEKSEAMKKAFARGARLETFRPIENIGVAASWNRILERAAPHPVIISNDDVVLGPESVEVLTEVVRQRDSFVVADGGPNANGWCLFAQSNKIFREVGPYDEGFYPAYYEDSDYLRRLTLAGIGLDFVQSSHKHDGWMTMRADSNNVIQKGQERSRKYFEEKWGGPPHHEHFREPFNGLRRAGRSRLISDAAWAAFVPTVRRWDVVNYLAEKVSDQNGKYLEIGVANGESMRHVVIPYKVGVDPSPQMSGVISSTAFFPMSSNEYFAVSNEVFDVAFVDGLHHADQAYLDIMNSCRVSAIVVAHDANPETEELQRVPYRGGAWTGDVWKAVARIRAEGRHTVRTIDADYGIAVIVPNRPEQVPQLPRETWEDLVRSRVELLGLVRPTEWQKAIDEILL